MRPVVHTVVGQAQVVPRDCSHSPIVFDLMLFSELLMVGADVIDATRSVLIRRT